MFDAVFEGAVGRLSRLFQTIAVNIVKPAVVSAANALRFHPAEFQRGAAMGAVQIDHAKPSVAVAKENKIFAEQARANRTAFGFYMFRKTHRPPVAAQHFAGRGSRPNAGDQFVFFSR
jgi:hypothetical protein